LCCTVFSQSNQSFSVHFDFNKHTLTATATARLDSFIRSTKTNGSEVQIQLDGHCDAVGNNAYNDALSNKRVAAVKDYLLKNNMAPGSFTGLDGHGKRNPLNNNATEEERLLNRRVEITIIPLPTKVDTVPVKPVAPAPEKKLSEQLADTAVKQGSKLLLKNINFVGGRHQFLPESFPVLEELLAALKKNPKLIIQVQGHICCLPGDVDGVDLDTGAGNLSEVRAQQVVAYLTTNGIAASRLSYIGLGHTQPLFSYPEKSEAERILNRRVEIKIIRK
jgi:outer membrane protein OmpA-like peptidoglycan-associated protein